MAGDRIDEVFIGSCMTNIGHYRAAATVLEGQGENTARLWVCPPTRMDEEMLKQEGYYAIFETAGSRMEMPGCSLCMGNQARVEDNTTVFSTSTRNFNNRLGNGAQVYLGSAELAAVCAQLGRIPSEDQYLAIAAAKIDPRGAELYRYLNFDQIEGFEDSGRVVSTSKKPKCWQKCELALIGERVSLHPQSWRASRNLERLIEQRWPAVVITLVVTSLGAAVTGLLFKTGVGWLGSWRLRLLEIASPWLVLPLLGATGGALSGLLVQQLAPAAAGSGIPHVMRFLSRQRVPMQLRVAVVKLVAGILAIGSGFPLGPEGPSVQMGSSVGWQMARWFKAPPSLMARMPATSFTTATRSCIGTR